MSKWKDGCLLCAEDIINRVDWNPSPNDLRMSLELQLHDVNGISFLDYIKEYLPNLDKEIYQFPPSRFHSQADKHLMLSDLKSDAILEDYFKEKGLRIPLSPEREFSMKKEDICRRIYDYANSIIAKPSLILSQYEYARHARRHRNDYDQDFEDVYMEGKCDCVWIAPNHQLLLFSIKPIFKETRYNIESVNDEVNKELITKEIRNAWKETNEARLFFQSLTYGLQSPYLIHQIIVLPNLTSDTLTKYLCTTNSLCKHKESLILKVKKLSHNSYSRFPLEIEENVNESLN